MVGLIAAGRHEIARGCSITCPSEIGKVDIKIGVTLHAVSMSRGRITTSSNGFREINLLIGWTKFVDL
jgi:hypothetical protein